jgi:transposase
MERQRYPDDLSDEEWNELEPLLKAAQGKGGVTPKHSRREILNAIFYVLRTGCSWRHLPHDFPPWRAVYVQFSRWKHKGLIEQIHNTLREKLRIARGRNKRASEGIADSQTVKTTEKGGSVVLMAEKRLKEESVIYLLTLRD